MHCSNYLTSLELHMAHLSCHVSWVIRPCALMLSVVMGFDSLNKIWTFILEAFLEIPKEKIN